MKQINVEALNLLQFITNEESSVTGEFSEDFQIILEKFVEEMSMPMHDLAKSVLSMAGDAENDLEPRVKETKEQQNELDKLQQKLATILYALGDGQSPQLFPDIPEVESPKLETVEFTSPIEFKPGVASDVGRKDSDTRVKPQVTNNFRPAENYFFNQETEPIQPTILQHDEVIMPQEMIETKTEGLEQSQFQSVVPKSDFRVKQDEFQIQSERRFDLPRELDEKPIAVFKEAPLVSKYGGESGDEQFGQAQIVNLVRESNQEIEVIPRLNQELPPDPDPIELVNMDSNYTEAEAIFVPPDQLESISKEPAIDGHLPVLDKNAKSESVPDLPLRPSDVEPLLEEPSTTEQGRVGLAGESDEIISNSSQNRADLTQLTIDEVEVEAEFGDRGSEPIHQSLYFGGVAENDFTIEHNQQNVSFADISQQIYSEVVEQMQFQLLDGEHQVMIKLKPDHLGDVKIKLSLNQGVINAEFVANNQAVSDVILAALPQLRLDLAQLGINLGELDVGFDFQQHSHDSNHEQPNQKRKANLIHSKLGKVEVGYGFKTDLQIDLRA